MNQIETLELEIAQLTQRIHDAQITAGDALSLLTRCLREKHQKLEELRVATAPVELAITPYNGAVQQMVRVSQAAADTILAVLQSHTGMIEPTGPGTPPPSKL